MGPYLAHNVEFIGYHDLDGRPAFKLAMQEVDGRWYLYMGHLWHRGWTVLDVTDPTRVEHVAFLPGPENTWTIQVQVADGKMITALERIAPGWGGKDGGEFSEGFLIWDVSEPRKPRQLGHFRTHSTGTHRNFYDGGHWVHVAGGASGFDLKIYRIVDISSPESPKEISHFLLPGQKAGEQKDGARLSFTVPRMWRETGSTSPMERGVRSSWIFLISHNPNSLASYFLRGSPIITASTPFYPCHDANWH